MFWINYQIILDIITRRFLTSTSPTKTTQLATIDKYRQKIILGLKIKLFYDNYNNLNDSLLHHHYPGTLKILVRPFTSCIQSLSVVNSPIILYVTDPGAPYNAKSVAKSRSV